MSDPVAACSSAWIAPTTTAEGCRWTSWRSSNAIEWRRVGSVVGRVPAALPEPWWIEPRALTVAGDHLGLIARLSDETGAGGWSPGGPQLAGVIGFAVRAPAPADRLMGWTSATGERWTKARVTGVTDETGPIGPNAIVQAPGSARALRDGAIPALITSQDGTTWVDVAPLPAGWEWGPPVGLLWADDASVLYLAGYGPGGGGGVGSGGVLGGLGAHAEQPTRHRPTVRWPAPAPSGGICPGGG